MRKGFGVDLVVDQQATGLRMLGYEVTVYAFRQDRSYYSNRPYKLIIIHRWVPKLLPVLKWCMRLKAHELLVAHTSPFFEALPSMRSSHITIAYEHGTPTPDLFPEPDRSRRESAREYKRKHVYEHVDACIGISRFIIEDTGMRSAKLIYNGADHLDSDPANRGLSIKEQDEFCARYGIRKNKLVVLTVCRLGAGEGQYKGIDAFVQCKTILDEEKYRFVVVGRGSAEQQAELESRGIRVVLNATKRELIMAYRVCDVFITFSKWEGFNLPLAEAQRFRKPGLALDIACHREVTPFVFSGVSQAAEIIGRLNKESARKMGVKSFEHIRNFRWDRNVYELRSCLDQIYTGLSAEKHFQQKTKAGHMFGDMLLKAASIMLSIIDRCIHAFLSLFRGKRLGIGT